VRASLLAVEVLPSYALAFAPYGVQVRSVAVAVARRPAEQWRCEWRGGGGNHRGGTVALRAAPVSRETACYGRELLQVSSAFLRAVICSSCPGLPASHISRSWRASGMISGGSFSLRTRSIAEANTFITARR